MVEDGSLRQLPLAMEHSVASQESVPASPGTEGALKVVAVYEDFVAQQRAMALWDRVSRLVGAEAVCIESWSVDELSDPGALQAAVSATIHADIIVVSIHAAATLSPDLCAWIDAWLPQRRRYGGSLIAVVGLAGHAAAASDCAQQYLRTVTVKARMDFVLQEYRTALPHSDPAAGSQPLPAKPEA